MSAQKEDRLKSWILLLAGLSGIGYQQYTGKTDWMLLLIFTVMTGVPGVTTIISLLRSSQTTLQSSLPPSEESAQGSESSRTTS